MKVKLIEGKNRWSYGKYSFVRDKIYDVPDDVYIAAMGRLVKVKEPKIDIKPKIKGEKKNE